MMKKTKRILINSLIFFILLSGICFIPDTAKAASATLYLYPSSGTYVLNQTFTVGVKVNTGGEVVNAAEGVINYDANLLEVTGVSKGGSIFPFWTTEPGASGGSIRFGGGLPPPAYKGTAGHIINVTFKAKKAGSARVAFASGAVLANDGKGTNILASMGSASYTLSPKVDEPAKKTPPKTTTDTKPKTQPKTEPKKEEAITDYNKPDIKSPTHPDPNTWYSAKKVKFEWELPEGVTGVSIKFDNDPTTDPGPESDGDFNEKEYDVEADGIYYLHLKFKDNRRWGTLEHFRVMIDSNPPKPFEVEVRQIDVGEWPELHFKTDDDDSGLKEYEIHIGSLEEQSHMLEPEDNILKVSGLNVGEHTAIVKAIDNAGNERSVTVKFTIHPIDSPVIQNYPRDLKSSDRFYVNGTAVINSSVSLFIQKDGRFVSSSTVSVDGDGNWMYIHNKGLENGRYVFWAEAVNKNGIKSNPSKKSTFLVTAPIFVTIGDYVINYFTVFVSLLFMTILIILIIYWIVSIIRKKLKKETIEVEEVIHKNAENMKKIVNEEFERLKEFEGKRNYKPEKERTIKRIIDRIDENEQKSLKEVKDVEEILK